MTEQDYNDIYYRVFKDREGQLCAVTLQHFDECHYDQSRFVSDLKFKNLMDAMDWIKEYKEKQSRIKGFKKSEVKETLVDLFAANHETLTDARAYQIIELFEDMGALPVIRDADSRSSYGYAKVKEWAKEEENE